MFTEATEKIGHGATLRSLESHSKQLLPDLICPATQLASNNECGRMNASKSISHLSAAAAFFLGVCRKNACGHEPAVWADVCLSLPGFKMKKSI